jgi:hypothetical protein
MESGPASVGYPAEICLGIMFIAHAYLKIAVFTAPGFASFLT